MSPPASERLLNNINPLTSSELSSTDWGSHADHQKAKEEFERFALNTWRGLVTMEKALVIGTPSTALFCRLDIGIMIQGTRVEYFVNEIERSLTTSLWMTGMDDGHHGVLADTLGLGLHRWITGMRDPCHL